MLYTVVLLKFLLRSMFCSFPRQIAELKAKRDQNQEQEKQKRTRIEHLEKTVKQQQQELKKRASQVAEFERVRIVFWFEFLNFFSAWLNFNNALKHRKTRRKTRV